MATCPAYAAFEPFEISWGEFATKWLPGLDRDGLLVGVNWSGARVLGYDVEPREVLDQVTRAIEAGTPK